VPKLSRDKPTPDAQPREHVQHEVPGIDARRFGYIENNCCAGTSFSRRRTATRSGNSRSVDKLRLRLTTISSGRPVQHWLAWRTASVITKSVRWSSDRGFRLNRESDADTAIPARMVATGPGPQRLHFRYGGTDVDLRRYSSMSSCSVSARSSSPSAIGGAPVRYGHQKLLDGNGSSGRVATPTTRIPAIRRRASLGKNTRMHGADEKCGGCAARVREVQHGQSSHWNVHRQHGIVGRRPARISCRPSSESAST